MAVNVVMGMEKLYTIIHRCLTEENKPDGLLEDVETIVNSYYQESHLDEPILWITQHPAIADRQADISKTMDLIVPFEIDAGVYDPDLDTADLESQNMVCRSILAVLKNWQRIQAEELPGRRLIRNITLQTYSPVGYVNVIKKSDKVATTGVILNVIITINWHMCIKELMKRRNKGL